MLVNALKMRPDVKSVHMGCMACAAGALGINLVQDLLKANPNSTALFVPHENVTRGALVFGQLQSVDSLQAALHKSTQGFTTIPPPLSPIKLST
jgi:predicted naringenin-chalcone synthase